MSIQRWNVRSNGAGSASNRENMVKSEDGRWVIYESHVAEIEAMRAACIAAVSAAYVEQMRQDAESIADAHRGNGSAEWDICCQVCQKAATEAMRAACIAAVREVWARKKAFYGDRPFDAEVIQALREVQA